MLNWSLMGAWQNWLLVAFSLAILLFIIHAFARTSDFSNNDYPAFALN